MRIIIEIEGAEAAVKSAQIADVSSQPISLPTTITAPITSVEVTPPPEVIAAAAAVGAENAGAAPTAGVRFPGIPPLLIPETESFASVASVGDTEAGAAPTASLNVQDPIETEETEE